MYWSKLTLFCNKNFISFSFFFHFRLASTLLLHPTWYQTHPVMTWEHHLLLIKHSLMASLFVCLLHTQHFYLPVLVLEILSCSRQKYVLFFWKNVLYLLLPSLPPFISWLITACIVCHWTWIRRRRVLAFNARSFFSYFPWLVWSTSHHLCTKPSL